MLSLTGLHEILWTISLPVQPRCLQEERESPAEAGAAAVPLPVWLLHILLSAAPRWRASEQSGRCACGQGRACSSHLGPPPAERKLLELLKSFLLNTDSKEQLVSSHWGVYTHFLSQICTLKEAALQYCKHSKQNTGALAGLFLLNPCLICRVNRKEHQLPSSLLGANYCPWNILQTERDVKKKKKLLPTRKSQVYTHQGNNGSSKGKINRLHEIPLSPEEALKNTWQQFSHR